MTCSMIWTIYHTFLKWRAFNRLWILPRYDCKGYRHHIDGLTHWSYVFFALTHRYTIMHLYNKVSTEARLPVCFGVVHPWPGNIALFILWKSNRDRGSGTLLRLDRADSRFEPSQWVTVLLCIDVSHWLGASLESTLLDVVNIQKVGAFCFWNSLSENELPGV